MQRREWSKCRNNVALLWVTDKLRSDKRERTLAPWAAKGKQTFEEERVSTNLAAARHDAAVVGKRLTLLRCITLM
ncbi:hypothetical protein CFR77_14335 [Komagataeibacter sucrofermentans]|uniref:Uncharacterized protein n=1 Tax=Komagataeibacter sucrofermentans TaxID=1053551 RepID=A0A318QIB1_9PROT|nr:hypothetical protein CFR77_14335 [Komagataeibacter sucrofermentans]GBQ48996.1 hypothetical protein AA15973_1635 [Komagataeibacter sucrofermentans DSM 15973]